jgi:2-oxoglutarate dehydrogenase E1 component
VVGVRGDSSNNKLYGIYMNDTIMQKFLASSALNAGSMSYLEELYETYLADPNAVDSYWRQYFDQLPVVSGKARETAHLPIQQKMLALIQSKGPKVQMVATIGIEHERNQSKVLKLIEAFRARGHLQAQLDPLNLSKPSSVPELTLGFHDLHERDLDTVFNADQLAGLEQATLRDIYAKLKEIYCGSIGAEYMYITDIREQEWIRQRLEEQPHAQTFSPNLRKRIFERLNAAEGLETYLHTRFVGQKRFSLEGGDAQIPFVDEIIQRGGNFGVKEVIIGMAHRGRLNMLVNVLGKVPSELFAEFEGKHNHDLVSGDVKYHQGFSSTIHTQNGNVHLALAFNPSHLEIVSPVVEGSVRARQDRGDDVKRTHVLPLAIHGDAAFSGQGVVMETFCMSQTRAYTTGGTVHLVINNQVGFTTSNPQDARSTLYCTDVAKMIESPVFHVNGDDAEAVVFIAQLALDYRMTFGKDVVVDLFCYRRHGHNEADEPSATQPLMYQVIKQHATPATLYAQQLVAAGVMTEAEVKAVQDNYVKALDEGQDVAADLVKDTPSPYTVNWTPYMGARWTDSTPTTYPVAELKKLALKMTTIPKDFKLQPQVAKMLEQRQKMAAGEVLADWGFAENLAYATLLEKQYPVRITGQDVGRGTFSHRHAVLYDQNNGQPYISLQHLSPKEAKFTLYDSLLSEEAVLAFEYGYATAEPKGLVIWEAQFGDFANGAQVVIDQFISSGEVKWGRLCGLTLLLPHGYEGQGPEHSSARLERYLQLCANNNMQVCVPTTPAQVYHMLRRQVVRPYRKPLVVMTPKSLLRHKLAVSSLTELADGKFQNVIGEIDPIKPEKVRKVVFCSGKVYYDLLAKRREREQQDVAIIRIEQLYPVPVRGIAAILEAYPNAKEVVWCQEEPKNQGSWTFIFPRLHKRLRDGQTLTYAGRKASASPAAGYLSDHLQQQVELVDQALS